MGEYVALCLLNHEYGASRADAVAFLSVLGSSTRPWSDAFWSVVGKCPEDRLGSDLYDGFSRALENAGTPQALKKAVSAMSRFSRSGASTLAGVLLWSAALPGPLTWTDLDRLGHLTDAELRAQAAAFATYAKNKQRYRGRISFKVLFDVLLPHIGEKVRAVMLRRKRMLGGPSGPAGFGARAFVRLFWSEFPQYRPLLLNGLCSRDEALRRFCAEKIRTCDRGQSFAIAVAEALVAEEDDPGTIAALQESIRVLRRVNRPA